MLKVENENKVVGMLEDTTQEPNSLIEGSYLYGKLSLHTDIKQTYIPKPLENAGKIFEKCVENNFKI